MIDFKKIFGFAGKAGATASDALAAAKNQAASFGISSAALEGLMNQVKQMFSDGKITKEEVIEKIKPLAAAKGIPVSAIQTALNLLVKN